MDHFSNFKVEHGNSSENKEVAMSRRKMLKPTQTESLRHSVELAIESRKSTSLDAEILNRDKSNAFSTAASRSTSPPSTLTREIPHKPSSRHNGSGVFKRMFRNSTSVTNLSSTTSTSPSAHSVISSTSSLSKSLGCDAVTSKSFTPPSSPVSHSALTSSDSNELKIGNLKSSVDSFLKSFLKKKLTPEEQRNEVFNFLQTLDQSISPLSTSSPSEISSLSPLKSNAGLWKESDSFAIMDLRDELQSYLFFRTFQSFSDSPENKEHDFAFEHRLVSLYWISPSHLDIDPKQRNYVFWDAAQAEIRLLNTFITPKEKLTCILNTCKILIHLLEDAGCHASADDFLPHLIFVTIRANVPHLQTNIKFISRFTEEDVMNGESYCFFTHLISTIMFIESIEASSLNIEPEEFYRLMNLSPRDADDFQKDSTKSSSSLSSSSPSMEIRKDGTMNAGKPFTSLPLTANGGDRRRVQKALRVLGANYSNAKLAEYFGFNQKTIQSLPGSLPKNTVHNVSKPVGPPDDVGMGPSEDPTQS